MKFQAVIDFNNTLEIIRFLILLFQTIEQCLYTQRGQKETEAEHLITALHIEGFGVDIDMWYFTKIKKALRSMTFIKSAEPAYSFLPFFFHLLNKNLLTAPNTSDMCLTEVTQKAGEHMAKTTDTRAGTHLFTF